MVTKSTAVVLALLVILTVLTVPSGVVVGPQQQIAFAQGVEEDSGGGEVIPFDDVQVIDGEEVIEIGSEGGGEEEQTGSDDIFSLQSIFDFLAQFDLDDEEGSEGDDAGAGGGEEDGDNNGGEGEVQQTDNNVEQQDSDTTQTRTQSQTETSVIVDRDVQGIGEQVEQDPSTGTPGGPGVVGPPGCLTCA